MRFLNKYSEFIVIILILGFAGFYPSIKFIANHYRHISNGSSSGMYTIEMWFYMFYLMSAVTITQLFAPLNISVISVRGFCEKVKSSFLINEIQVRGYKHTIINEVRKVYLKALIPLFSYSVILFCLSIIFHTNLGIGDSAQYIGIDDGLLYVIVVHINMFLFSLSIANISMIVVLLKRNYVLSILITQILFVGINLVTYLLSLILSDSIGIPNLDSYTYLNNLIALDGNVSYLIMIVISFLFFAITFLALYFKVRDKERVIGFVE